MNWSQPALALFAQPALALSALFIPSLTCAAPVSLSKIKVPQGFKVELYAEVPGARSLTLGPSGTVFVGSRDKGNVYAVVDKNGDHKADEVVTVARGLNSPNGVAYRDGALYVAEISRILRYDRIDATFRARPQAKVVRDSFPKEGHHGWKFIKFGPDGMLYVPVGAPCNTCLSEDPVYASITRMKPDGSGFEIVAHGVRNTVGFDWHPETKQLWFTDNGRDMLGDDAPPDELNELKQVGNHFGYPFCHGTGIKDPEFGSRRPCKDFVPPVRDLGAHVAALGMRFYTGKMFPKEFQNRIFIAEHGSWNRSEPSGYRVTMVTLRRDGTPAYEVFASGWLSGRDVSGRPVDVEVLGDGSLLVSDDRAGAIYRISY